MDDFQLNKVVEFAVCAGSKLLQFERKFKFKQCECCAQI